VKLVSSTAFADFYYKVVLPAPQFNAWAVVELVLVN